MAALPTVPVTGTVYEEDGVTLYNGPIYFNLPILLRHNDGTVVLPGWRDAVTIVNGVLDTVLLYVDAAGWTPNDWAWEVRIRRGSVWQSYALAPKVADGAVNLGDLELIGYVPAPGSEFAPWGHTHADKLSLTGGTITGNLTVNGIAALGSKNGSTNLRMAGYLDIFGAPVSGTWDAGDVVMTKTGVYRCAAGGTPGTWTNYSPYDRRAIECGYAGWNFDPGLHLQGTAIMPTSGLSQILRFQAQASTVSAVRLHVLNANAVLTHFYATLHNDAGAILGGNARTANEAVNMQSGGERNLALIGQMGTDIGAYYKLRIWGAGATMPTLSRAVSNSGPTTNMGLPTSGPASTPYGWASAESGLTDMASAPDQIGTLTPTGLAWWVGVRP